MAGPALDPHLPSAKSLTRTIDHLRHIVGERDRTKLGGLLIATMRDVFGVDHAVLSRYVAHQRCPFVIDLARLSNKEVQVQDAYLVSPRYGVPLDDRPRLGRCMEGEAPLLATQAGRQVCVLPTYRMERSCLLIEMERASPFDEGDLHLAHTILGLFDNHLSVIDYAETDTLTGLMNRKTFDEHLYRLLTGAWEDAEAGGIPHPIRRHAGSADAQHWLGIVDIDHFKRINDGHGHLIGDEVLLRLAHLMRESFRMDDQLFRFGGEEFIVLLQPASAGNALRVFERFRQRIEAHEFPVVGSITVSIGFTAVVSLDNPSNLVERADKALYYAKEHGRNRVESHEALSEAGAFADESPKQESDIELF